MFRYSLPMPTLLPEQAKAMNAKRITKGPRNPRADIIDMQRILIADIRNPKTMPHIRAQCARAYDVLEERLRILNNKPLPGMLRPDIAQEREAKRASKRKGPSLLPLPEVPSKESLSPQ